MQKHKAQRQSKKKTREESSTRQTGKPIDKGSARIPQSVTSRQQAFSSSQPNSDAEESGSVSSALAVEINRPKQDNTEQQHALLSSIVQHSLKNIQSQQEETAAGAHTREVITTLDTSRNSEHRSTKHSGVPDTATIIDSLPGQSSLHERDTLSASRFETILPSTNVDSCATQPIGQTTLKRKKRASGKGIIDGSEVLLAGGKGLSTKKAKKNAISFPSIRLLGSLGMLPIVCDIDEYWLSKLQEVVQRHKQRTVPENPSESEYVPFDAYCKDWQLPMSFQEMNPDTVNRFKASSGMLCSLSRVARDGMRAMALSLFPEGHAESQHLELFDSFDKRKWCTAFQI